jgi:hypothetical protein
MKKVILPYIDHGIDILGDEWEEEEDEAEMKKGIDKYVDEYEQRNDPEHPYCTNWPVNKEKKNEKI